MSAHAQPAPSAGDAVAAPVLVGAALLALAVVPVLVALPHDRVALDATLPVLAWFPLGVAGVVTLDRRPASPVAWSAVAVSGTPALLLAGAATTPGADLSTLGLREAVAQVGPWGLAPLAAVAACAALPGSWPTPRARRRWGLWVALTCCLTVAASAAAWALGPPWVFGVVAACGLAVVTAVVTASSRTGDPRPVDEPVLDLALLAALLGTAAGTGGLLRLVALHERVAGADVVGVLAAAVTAALGVPAALHLRRTFLVRRYGSGTLSASEVADLSAGPAALGGGGPVGAVDPRQLLTRAAGVVSAASGRLEVQVLLDDVEPHPGWVARPLLVGDARVGTLLVEPRSRDGMERRQDRTVGQLLPTVALLAYAVILAVDAEHARRDVARERAAERARILADLHDDLGPVLAGMSMRVAAARTRHPVPELDALAADLARCRSDLRRVVSGLVPPALRDGDPAAAVAALVEAFASAAGPEVVLEGQVPPGTGPRAAAVAYRVVAEGVTNAVRHADATRVAVAVRAVGAGLVVAVTDDGRGGAVVPGVGLTSLRARAEELGGTLAVRPAPGGGTQLSLELPEASR